MAPRRRRQPGLTRINTAVDQVSCLGFSRQLVRRTVQNLLKVYGDDGWNLIEEDSYKVVLDFILDEQESAQKQNSHDESSSQQETPENELVMADINEVAANASLTIHTVAGNNESCKDIITMDKTAQSSTLQDDQSEDNINIKNSENTPLALPPSDVAHTPVNVSGCKRKPSYGWISDDDDDEKAYLITLTPANKSSISDA